eukprot:scaffold1167_cov418-Prasinococcus_capsulatus_cf.AAC.18
MQRATSGALILSCSIRYAAPNLLPGLKGLTLLFLVVYLQDGSLNVPGTCVRSRDGTERLSVQDSYDPHSTAFASNRKQGLGGLGLRSWRITEGPIAVNQGGLEADFVAEATHQGFPGVVCGGILGCLVESHGNWTAALAMMDEAKLSAPPLTVTASFQVDCLKPTPIDRELKLISHVTEMNSKRAKVVVDIYCDLSRNPESPPALGDSEAERELSLCARGTGVFMKIGAIRAL